MKKMMIMAAMIAVAISANAQNRYDNQNQMDYSGQATYQNQPSYQPSYPSQNGGGFQNGSFQNRGYENGGYQNSTCTPNMVDGFMRETHESLEKGIQRGLISSFEARNLFQQFEYIKEKKFQMQRNGFLSGREQNELMADLRGLNMRIAQEKHEKFGREGYGRNNFRHEGRNW